MKKHRIVRAFLATFLVFLAFCAIAGVFLAESALHPAGKPFTSADENEGRAWAEDENASLDQVSITAEDGVILRGWELRPQNANGKVVILLHGLRDNRLGMRDYGDIFLLHGYGVLVPDARAHGASGGNLATYGLLEKEDIHLWIDWLVAREHPSCVYGFGESMGAAQVLQAIKTEKCFCAVAAEGSFSTFRETAYDRVGQRFRTGPWLGRTILWPVVESAFLYVRLRYGLDIGQVSPEDAVAVSRVPVLLIHGQTDMNIPIRHSRRIAARNRSVALWELPNTGHSNAIDTSPNELDRILIEWFGSHRSFAHILPLVFPPPGDGLEQRGQEVSLNRGGRDITR